MYLLYQIQCRENDGTFFAIFFALPRNDEANLRILDGIPLFRQSAELFLTFLREFYDSFLITEQMHKAKGREFDTVYLMLNRYDLRTDAAKRAVYVALTRAKEALSIHYYGTFMEGTPVPGAVYQQDIQLWPEPNEIVLHLGHKDVVLDFFKNKKARNLALRSGQPLTAEGTYG